MSLVPSPCRSCGAPCVWLLNVKTEKTMCLNATPDPLRGNVRALPAGTCEVLTRDIAVMERAANAVLFISHHATCPQRSFWRRRR